MKKKLLSIILTVFMLLMVAPNKIHVKGDMDYFDYLADVISNPAAYTENEYFDLTVNGNLTYITLKESIISSTGGKAPITVSGNKTVVIILNGNTINRGLADTEAKENGSVFKVSEGAILRIDSDSNTKGSIAGGNTKGNGGAFEVKTGSGLILNDLLLGNNKAKNGGVIYNDGGVVKLRNCDFLINSVSENGGGIANVNNGNMELNGCTLCMNKAGKNGGAIYNSGNIILSNTKIGNEVGGNYASNLGGGISVAGGTCTFVNSEINKCEAYCGGGVSVEKGVDGSQGRFETSGGKIIDCVAKKNNDSGLLLPLGGGVYVKDDANYEVDANNAVATFADTFTISNCKSEHDGGGIYCNGVLALESVTISNNTAENFGGGVYLNNQSLFVGGSAKIKDGNTDEEGKSNLYLADDAKLTIGNGTDVKKPTNGMDIGIKMKTPGIFSTKDSTGYDSYFKDDRNKKIVSYYEDQRLMLGDTYSATFNMNGHGNQVLTRAVEKNGKLSKPVNPTEAGYTFVDWYADKELNNKFDFNTKFNENKTLYALWRADGTTAYTVSFNMNGHGSQVPKQIVYENEKAQKPTSPKENNYRFDGWYTSSDLLTEFDFTTPITLNTTIYAKWTKTPSNNGGRVVPNTCTK